MKTRINKLLLLPILLAGLGLILAQPAEGQSGNYNGFDWNQIGNTIQISGYSGPGGAVTIPSIITNLPVTSIGDFAFLGCANLTNITIPNSVTSIGDVAFVNSGLATVMIPWSVTNIGVTAFGGCGNLTAIMVDPSNPAYASLAGVLFNNNLTALIQYPGGMVGSYTIPASVTSIGLSAFNDCFNLASVVMDANLISIGNGAFYGCSGLTSVTIPSGATNIGDAAFAFCYNLTGIYFQGNAPTTDSTVFENDNIATAYYLPATSGWSSPFAGIPAAMLNAPNPSGSLQVTIAPDGAIAAGAQWQVDGGIPQPSGAMVLGLSVGNHTVSFSTVSPWAAPTSQTVSVSANATVTATGVYTEPVQYQFTYITNADGLSLTITGYTGPGGVVDIPSTMDGYSVTSIGDHAFEVCSLTSITIPSSVTNIGDSAFFLCASLTNVLITGSVTSIGDDAFGFCYSLASVTIPSSVTSIGDAAFTGCNSLTSISIPGNVTSLGDGVFWDCTILTAITVDPANLVYSSVNGVLFNQSQTVLIECPEGISGNYAIPSTVTNIMDDAFNGCAGLTNVTVPGSVTSIGDDAFAYCTSLTAITVDPANLVYSSVNGVLFNQNQTALVECPAEINGNCTIPNTVTSIEDFAFDFCNLTSVTIPGSVTNIGNYAFSSCFGLTSVTIPGSVTAIGDWAFSQCSLLTNVYFQGNAPVPADDSSVFSGDPNATVYYSSGTSGWGSTFDGIPAVMLYEAPNTFTYTTNNGAITITKCTGSDSILYIPSEINGYPVTGIGAAAGFQTCSNLITVFIPSSMTNLTVPFLECYSLTAIYVDANNPIYGSINGILSDKNQTTILEYPAGLGGNFTIPASVMAIGARAFAHCTNLTSITIPSNVVSIGVMPFNFCVNLTSIMVDASNPDYSSMNGALFNKSQTAIIAYPTGLGYSYTVPNGVNNIGTNSFYSCASLTNITLPASVQVICPGAFFGCTSLRSVCFAGNAPPSASATAGVFSEDTLATAYYLPGMSGWSSTFDGIPTAQWLLPYPIIVNNKPSLTMQTKSFGFNISWATNASVVVEACTNLVNPVWLPVQTNTLNNGTNYFTELGFTNYPSRFYRLGTP